MIVQAFEFFEEADEFSITPYVGYGLTICRVACGVALTKQSGFAGVCSVCAIPRASLDVLLMFNMISSVNFFKFLFIYLFVFCLIKNSLLAFGGSLFINCSTNG